MLQFYDNYATYVPNENMFHYTHKKGCTSEMRTEM